MIIGFLQWGKLVLVPSFLTCLITSSTSPGSHWLRPLPDVYKLPHPPSPRPVYQTWELINLVNVWMLSPTLPGVPVKYAHQLGRVSVPDWGEACKNPAFAVNSDVSLNLPFLFRSGTHPSSWAGCRFHPVHVTICQITWRWAAIHAHIHC